MAAPMTSARSLALRPAGTAAATTTVVTGPSTAPIIAAPSGTLRLRGTRSSERHIQWAEDVIDNEGMGKKSSKVCCIYHKNRAPDESSSDESDSSSSDSDSEPDNSRARPVGGARRRQHNHHNHYNHPQRDSDPQNANADGSSNPRRSSASGKRKPRRPSPNAYERVPRYGKSKVESS